MTFLVIVCYALGFFSMVILRDARGIALVLVLMLFNLGVYFYWSKYRKKIRYPLVPPEGRTDMHVPRTNIPRPIIEDFRKIKEKKRKFAKIDKIVREKKVRKKK